MFSIPGNSTSTKLCLGSDVRINGLKFQSCVTIYEYLGLPLVAYLHTPLVKDVFRVEDNLTDLGYKLTGHMYCSVCVCTYDGIVHCACSILCQLEHFQLP